ELGDGGLSQTIDLLEPFQWRRDHLGKGAERGEQLLCQRFHVALRDGAKQNELEHFVIADRLAAGRENPLPQALAMAVVMRRLVGGRRRCRRFVALGHRAVIRAARSIAPARRARMTAPSDFAMAANGSVTRAGRRRDAGGRALAATA